MKKRIIYLLMAAIGTVGFTGCGPGQNTNQDRTGTYDSPTGTQMGTENRTTTGNTGTTTGNTGTTTGNNTGTTTGNTTGTTGNTGNRTATTTGTSGTRTTTTTGTAGTTTGNTGQRSADANNNASGAGTTQATQIAGQTGNEDRQAARNNFRLDQATDYSYNNENYRFTPDQRGINITRDQNGTQTPYGTMRSFGDDGYFMLTTTNTSGQEEVSVGRFDERGNLTVYRYDKKGDKVTEQNYRSNSPMNQNNQNNR